MKRMRKFLFSRAGAAALEYAVIAGLVSVAIITGAATLGAALNTKLQAAGDKVAALRSN